MLEGSSLLAAVAFLSLFFIFCKLKLVITKLMDKKTENTLGQKRKYFFRSCETLPLAYRCLVLWLAHLLISSISQNPNNMNKSLSKVYPDQIFIYIYLN